MRSTLGGFQGGLVGPARDLTRPLLGQTEKVAFFSALGGPITFSVCQSKQKVREGRLPQSWFFGGVGKFMQNRLQFQALSKEAKNFFKSLKNVPFEVEEAILTSKWSVFSRFGPPKKVENRDF